MPPKPARPENLKEDCLSEALKIIESKGVESLSMREVARRLGVSHQAPYKHFESRDHILAEVIGRAYESFGQWLEMRSRQPDIQDEMLALGLAYFEYALQHPLQYRLMFSTPLPDPDDHPDMMVKADRCYTLLKESLANHHYADLPEQEKKELVELDALFVWSLVHGLSSVLKSDAITAMSVDQKVLDASIPHILRRIGTAMGGTIPEQLLPAADQN